MVTEQQVLESLRHIVDPDLGQDIVSLGFVKNIKIDGGKVSFCVELTTPACPIKKVFKERSEQAVAALPGGSTNVFARTIGLPNDPIESTAVVLEALEAGSIRRVGLGVANGRYFCFHVGIGFDAALVEQVEKRASLKRWAGHALFMYAGIDTLLRHYDRKHPHFTVAYPDGDRVDDGFFAVCCNTNPYTFIGNSPFDIAPDANLENGLTMVTVRSLRLDRAGRIVAKALRGKGALQRDPSIHYRPDVDALVVEGIDGEPFPYQLDGDHLGSIRRIDLRHRPEVMDLVVPVGT